MDNRLYLQRENSMNLDRSFTSNDCKVSIRTDGTISSLQARHNGAWETIPFRSDANCGPKWNSVEMKAIDESGLRYEGIKNNLRYSIEYTVDGKRLSVTARLKNESADVFQPDSVPFSLGINTEMIEFPGWNERYFPTLIRAEKTHLWGYFMSPKGNILTLGIDAPVASWNYEFQTGQHRIYTVSLDMLHQLPLPSRHPQDMTQLAPGQEKEWTIFLEPVSTPEEVKPCIEKNIGAPMLEASHYTMVEGEEIQLSIFSHEAIDLAVTGPSGSTQVLLPEAVSDGIYQTIYLPHERIGDYNFTVTNRSGMISAARVHVRHPWSWYLKQARQEAVRIPQKATTHAESWLGHFSTFLAKRHFPDPELDAQAEHNFRTILPLMFDLKEAAPILHVHRIQNVFYMISLLVDVFQANSDIRDLELASGLADWVIKCQGEDGAYYSGETHYTCVAYAAKSMLELAAMEKKLGKNDAKWQSDYQRHYDSAKAAIDDLERRLDNIGTEGQGTYEDGMIGCSATQLAMMSLLAGDSDDGKRYLKAAEYMFSGHRCLDQMIVPDSRMRGGTLRFWEAQYDVLIEHNMMNSPHGWTAWRIPGFVYMYQITGDEQWLKRAMESLGACVQLIDGHSGTLRWAFVQDPYVQASILGEDPADPTNPEGKRFEAIIGEQYVGMVSHFYHPPLNEHTGGHWGPGGSCDNDVHEVFKALEEVALTSAYVVERESGELAGYNCTVKKIGKTLQIHPMEEIVSRVHLNFRNKHNVNCIFSSGSCTEDNATGMKWIGPGGPPEDLR
jgi:hypothetical protein